jgi:orotidine-5'-phosphate decarboxylase
MQLTQIEQNARSMICLPLDGLTSLEALADRVNELAPYVGVFKVGKASFTRFGPEAVHKVHDAGGSVFLDLKYHDIPQTVKEAAEAAASLGVYMFNVHTAGGPSMMEAAANAVANQSRRPVVIGVTLLTSLEQKDLEEHLLVPNGITVIDFVSAQAQAAAKAGLDGIVCAAKDLASGFSSSLPAGFQYVTPGIQAPDGTVGGDQKRVETPYAAAKNGSSLLVIGRAITGHATPELRQQAAYSVVQDIARGIVDR